eukprot:352193-Chlamydomonas_euryale.AAC.33
MRTHRRPDAHDESYCRHGNVACGAGWTWREGAGSRTGARAVGTGCGAGRVVPCGRLVGRGSSHTRRNVCMHVCGRG